MQLSVKQLSFRYSSKNEWILKDVNFEAAQGERVGVIAPSGYGKTTFVKLLAGYQRPTEGEILLDGKSLDFSKALPIQMISQHPEKAINPRWKMQRVLEEAGQLRPDVLEAMGIEKAWLTRFPRELSGGELQRFCVARALCAATRFLIADEISTMLDVITQSQIWQVLIREVEQRDMGLIVVTHNPHLAKRVCTRIVDLRDLNHIDRIDR